MLIIKEINEKITLKKETLSIKDYTECLMNIHSNKNDCYFFVTQIETKYGNKNIFIRVKKPVNKNVLHQN